MDNENLPSPTVDVMPVVQPALKPSRVNIYLIIFFVLVAIAIAILLVSLQTAS